LFGWLSDRIGRKPIILAGCLLGAVTYHGAFALLTHAANPALEHALASAPVTVIADPADCNLLFDPVGGRVFKNSCDVARQALIASSVNFETEKAPAGSVAKVKVGDKAFDSVDGNKLDAKAFGEQRTAFNTAVTGAVTAAGYPTKGADPAAINMPLLILVLVYLAVLVTMVYGPIAAALVELFPTRIRYSGMSLPYHIGNGWFGGPAAADRGDAGRGDRKHLRRPVVSDRHRGHDVRRRDPVHSRDEGQGHYSDLNLI
jgi:MFS family permease